jgi:hypothetical protein
MKIIFNTTTYLQQVQETFNNRFPFLKIEFFADLNKPLNAENMVKNHQMEIGKLAPLNATEGIEIHGANTIKQLEEGFVNKFRIAAQVFHKRGQSWILTTTSDDETLDSLNSKAEEDNKPLPKEEVIDSADRMDLE